ncbi:MAG TPA: hypothetical protein PLD73_10860 [Candidatus Hydrogenedentes bacterium]|jgi:hypothetical protein|nr:hypothetical protein [Candidatus Hydrogenedentota bacterium]HPJ99432.1 hypothetical protein [Candidatus Hydrogenedentota bacterium]
MKRLLALVLVGVFMVGMAGCSGGAKDAAPAGSGIGESVAPSSEGASTELSVEPEESAEETSNDTAAAESAGGTELTGTKWQLGDYEINFKDDGKVLVKGGQISTLMPDGAEGEYKIEDGKFSVSILGQSFNGTWDGSKLVVDGNEAVLQ